MAQTKIPIFAHRHNIDGSWNSICPLCVITLARTKVETDLAAHEDTHICDPARLAQFATTTIYKDW